MDFWETAKRRQCIRHFDREKDIEDDEVRRLLETATMAPSAGNLQAWFFVVVRDDKTRQDLARAAFGQESLAEAPVVIVVCADLSRSASRYGERGSSLYCLQDTAAATQNLLLSATALDLGACWVGAFSEQAVANLLTLPSHQRPIALVPVGVPSRKGPRTPRRPLDEVVRFIR
ncbi:MAG: nitroreductase family protein [Chloroflexi bacterium]|nr:nitroreductase family protein [Chloroflexota bacterium]